MVSISEMEGMAIKVQFMVSRKTGGKYIGYKFPFSWSQQRL